MGAKVVVSLEGQILMEAELVKPVTVVGRHPACDIVIDSPHVSVRHMLFRAVNRTVYVEDLASTNGTIINGLSANHQVVHHLDLIEVGRHKLHFFDDTMLAASVTDIESTVTTEFERTMLAAHVPTQPAPSAAAAIAAAKAKVKPADDDLDRTRAIRREPGTGPTPLEQTRPGTAGPPMALKVVQGERKGEVISLDKANTMIGTAGADTALVVKRAGKLLIARLSGQRPLKLNRRELGPGTHPIAEQDVIDVGNSKFEVIPAAR
jgi:pSer/pThr/pTyr-binding forkhead associated (FHA) protein